MTHFACSEFPRRLFDSSPFSPLPSGGTGSWPGSPWSAPGQVLRVTTMVTISFTTTTTNIMFANSTNSTHISATNIATKTSLNSLIGGRLVGGKWEVDNVCEKKETPERLRGSPAASVSRPFVLRKKLYQGEGKRVFAGLHNLQLVLISKYSQNFIRKTRMLCFLQHSRQKWRKSMFLEQNSCF